MAKGILIVGLGSLVLLGACGGSRTATVQLDRAYTSLGYISLRDSQPGRVFIWDRETNRVEGDLFIPVREYEANKPPRYAGIVFYREEKRPNSKVEAKQITGAGVKANVTLTEEVSGQIDAGVSANLSISVDGYDRYDMSNPKTMMARYINENVAVAEAELELVRTINNPDRYYYVLARTIQVPHSATVNSTASAGAKGKFKVETTSGDFDVSISDVSEVGLTRSGGFEDLNVFRAFVNGEGKYDFERISSYDRRVLIRALRGA